MTAMKFDYEVYLVVSLPLTWTTLLKRVAANHYDYKCREAGTAGVINGLHNTACDGEFPSTFRLAWRDLDLLTKVMEQACYHVSTKEDTTVSVAIQAWIQLAKFDVEGRRVAIKTHFAEDAP